VSSVSDKGGDSVVEEDTTDFPMNLDDDQEQPIMMDSDDDNSELARRRRHSLRLSNQSGADASNHNEIGISFDVSTDNTEGGMDNSNIIIDNTTAKQRRPRKRRKIITDDGRTELSNDHIRSMIADTSDICRGSGRMNGDLIHPATWVKPKSGSAIVTCKDDSNMFYDYSDIDVQKNQNHILLWNTLVPQERLFCRPALSDDGHLSSELIHLWSRNCAPIINEPFRYELMNPITSKGIEQQAQKGTVENDDNHDEEDDEDVEHARNANRDDSEVIVEEQDDIAAHDPSTYDVDDYNNNNNSIPFDDEDDRIPIQNDDDDQAHLLAIDSTYTVFKPIFLFSHWLRLYDKIQSSCFAFVES
jgi:hypothetical protein